MVSEIQNDLKQSRGEVLRRARSQAGLSARKLAERINDRTPGTDLTDNAIYAYESGRVLLSRESAERVSAVLRVPLGELLLGDPDFEGTAGAEVGLDVVGVIDSGASERVEDRVLRRVFDLSEALLGTGRTLVRMLEVPRFELAGPGGFLHAFELLSQDVARLVDHEDVRELERSGRGGRQGSVLNVAAVAGELNQAATAGYGRLRKAAKKGGCATACGLLASELGKLVEALESAQGEVIAAGGLKPRMGGG